MAKPHSDALVIFGVTGDLAHKMIFPALYAMVKKGVSKFQSSVSPFQSGVWRVCTSA